MDQWMPCLVHRRLGEFGVEVRLGHEQIDAYLRFVAARCRPNSVLAAGYDLKVFFTAVGKQPAEVSTLDVLEFIAAQRAPRPPCQAVVRHPGAPGSTVEGGDRRQFHE